MQQLKPHVIAMGFSSEDPLPSGFVDVCNCRNWSLMTISHPQPDDPMIASALCVFITPIIISQLGEVFFKDMVQKSSCPWFLAWHPRKTTPKMLTIAHQLGIFTVRFTDGTQQNGLPMIFDTQIDENSDNTIQVGDARLNTETGFLILGLSTYNLSPKLTKLMELLLRNAGRYVTHAEIYREVLENNGTEGDMKMLVSNLRKKISDTSQQSPRIQNLRKHGYRYIEH